MMASFHPLKKGLSINKPCRTFVPAPDVLLTEQQLKDQVVGKISMPSKRFMRQRHIEIKPAARDLIPSKNHGTQPANWLRIPQLANSRFCATGIVGVFVRFLFDWHRADATRD